jgi:hypothetical protein
MVRAPTRFGFRRHRPRQLAPPLPNGENGPSVKDGGEPPLPNGENGQDRRGQYRKGNKGGTRNPFARHIVALRRALCAVLTEDDLPEFGWRLHNQAKAG